MNQTLLFKAEKGLTLRMFPGEKIIFDGLQIIYNANDDNLAQFEKQGWGGKSAELTRAEFTRLQTHAIFDKTLPKHRGAFHPLIETFTFKKLKK